MSPTTTAPKPTAEGLAYEAGLEDALRQWQAAPRDGSRELPVVTGVHLPPKQVFTAPQDNVLLEMIMILRDSGRVYVFGDTVVAERDGEHGKALRPLATGAAVEAGVEGLLANFMRCQAGDVEFPLPRWAARLVSLSDLLPPRLPRILQYAARPLFDCDYNLRSPGWHADTGMLIHGGHVDPDLCPPGAADLSGPDRLPPLLRGLLGGFCFRAAADVANAVAMLLSGILGNHFIGAPKAIFLIDGNQPGLGKTLLVRVAGLVLDGEETPVIPFTTDDAELEKRLCAELRRGGRSVVLIDNGKTANGAPVDSALLESLSMAPELSFRILGHSEVFRRPNDLVWTITMNTTKVSSDMMSRGTPIQLAYEGKPEGRVFAGPDPVSFARRERAGLLGELTGMVVRWNQAGRPAGAARHRCHEWAGVVGGILGVAGFPEFLTNYDEAAATFNTRLEMLLALADAVVAMGGPFVSVETFSE